MWDFGFKPFLNLATNSLRSTMKTTPRKIYCPTCSEGIEWNEDFPFRPFCSKRCQLIDLGEWAAENHRIEGDDTDLMSEDFNNH